MVSLRETIGQLTKTSCFVPKEEILVNDNDISYKNKTTCFVAK